MKKTFQKLNFLPLKMLFILGIFIIISNQTDAQWLNDLNRHAEKKIEREAKRRAEKKVDEGIDKGFDATEESIENAGKTDKDKNSKKNEGGNESQSESKASKDAGNNTDSHSGSNGSGNAQEGDTPQESQKTTLVWNRYDFIPGDIVIFEDAPGIDEENGEFPSRWDLESGNAEIMESNAEKVIVFPQGGTIVPYLKNSDEDYLPEVFTVEADVFFMPGYSRRLWIDLYDKKNQRKSNNTSIVIYVNSVTVGEIGGTYPNKRGNKDEIGGWRHISIAFTKGKLKIYLDDVRLVNIPHYEGNPTGITLEMDGYAADEPEEIQYIKNFRIAKGGVKYYDRVLSDGKIIVNGIKFDVNKATLKPESMGPINEIFELMEKNPEINFSVEGHTDSDGDEASNQALSENRAKTVMDQLISMGIDPGKLKSAGWGESKPLDSNASAEGKANNRRVEFVKF